MKGKILLIGSLQGTAKPLLPKLNAILPSPDVSPARVALPTRIQKFTVLKSAHIYKKHRVQYEIRTQSRLMQVGHSPGTRLKKKKTCSKVNKKLKEEAKCCLLFTTAVQEISYT